MFFVTTHAPRERTLEPVSGFLQTLSDVLFSPCESPFAIINHTDEYNCLQVLGVLLVSHQRYGWLQDPQNSSHFSPTKHPYQIYFRMITWFFQVVLSKRKVWIHV